MGDIDFDDLAATELTDIQRQILKYTEAKHVDLDIDRMLADAVEQAGVNDRAVRLLRNRLSLTELLKRYPEIESIPIEKPRIVVGMPRSG